jgi:flavin reductase (DIM6/NTAB) family NADH-FMN oxidoreductase RutF
MSRSDAAKLFKTLDRELWVVTAQAGSRRGGLIATFVSNSSLVPESPRVVVGLAKHHYTWGLVEASRAFVLHLVGEDQLQRVWHFGLQSGRDCDKLDGVATRVGVTGGPILQDAPAWLECQVEVSVDIGDRTLYLAEVVDASAPSIPPVLTFRRLLELAPPDRLRELEDRITRDIAIDAEAIRAWRSAPSGRSHAP